MALVGRAIIFVLLLVVLGMGVLAVVTWWNRRKPGALWFSIHAALATVWALLDLVSVTASSLDVTVWTMTLGDGFSNSSSLFLFLFVLSYLGYGNLSDRRKWAIGVLYTGTQIGLAVVGATSGLYYRNATIDEQFGLALVTAEQGPLLFLASLPSVLLTITAVVLIARSALASDRAWVPQAISLVLAILVPVFGVFVVGAKLIPDGLPTVTLLLLGSVFFYGYALRREGMFEISPASERIGVRQAFADLGAGVLVVGDGGTVLRANDAAHEMLATGTALVGSDVSDALEAFGSPNLADLPADAEREGRFYELSASPVGADIGYTVLIQDVTERRQREQRLSVLNRVLRHNLRNDINAMKVRIQLAAEQISDEELREEFLSINNIATDLVSVSEKAREIENVVGTGDALVQTRSVRDIVAEAVAEVRADHPDATITVDGPDVTIRTYPDLVRPAVLNLVENAVVHNDSPSSTVEVAVASSADGVTITVTDDGPGIPDFEVEVLTDTSETPLEHGSGLGLWLVNWAVTRLGGSVRFDTSTDGTAAVVEVPDLRLGGANPESGPIGEIGTGDD